MKNINLLKAFLVLLHLWDRLVIFSSSLDQSTAQAELRRTETKISVLERDKAKIVKPFQAAHQDLPPAYEATVKAIGRLLKKFKRLRRRHSRRLLLIRSQESIA